MKKRFRSSSIDRAVEPSYPTLDSFDGGRRSFLIKLGLAVAGGTIASSLAACGERTVTNQDEEEPDFGQLAGVARMPDAGVDVRRPGRDGGADDTHRHLGDTGNLGYAPVMDARADNWIIAGEAPQPDAAIDKLDMGLSGGAPMMDARADEP